MKSPGVRLRKLGSSAPLVDSRGCLEGELDENDALGEALAGISPAAAIAAGGTMDVAGVAAGASVAVGDGDLFNINTGTL